MQIRGKEWHLLGPAARYSHKDHIITDWHAEHQVKLSMGQRIADKLAAVVGGWPFIIAQSALLILWMGFNAWLALHPRVLKAWDPYPFILLNLVLSFQAAYTGPIVMMSQNRSSERDREMARSDYEINCRAEEEIKVLMEHLVHQDEIMAKMMDEIRALTETRSASLAAESPIEA